MVGVILSSLALAAGADPGSALRRDGKALYAEHCAGCHGKEGGGDGPLANDLRFKPRAFKEGKFAFGNTADAMVKTVLSGVPGQDVARMPAFAGVLQAGEIEAVVDYVRTLMPEQPLLTPADMRMDVMGSARIVRGILAPLREGERPLARGLLAGLPSGFTLQYATENVHLVAVRRGLFVLRSDWEGRGGRPLTPLGAALLVAPEPPEWIPFAVGAPPTEGEHARFGMTRAKLRETTVRGPAVEIKLDLVDEQGRVRAHVIERPRESVVAGGAGVVQEFEILATDEPVAVLCSIAVASAPALALPAPPDLVAAIPAGTPPLVRHSSEQLSIAGVTGWWVIRPPDGGFVCIRVEAPESAIVGSFNGEAHDCVDVQVVAGEEPVIVRRTTLVRAEASLERLQAMAREAASD